MGSHLEPEPTFFYTSPWATTSPIVTSTDGIYLTLETGQKVMDSTCGAAVSCIGHGNKRVINAIVKQLNKVPYAHPGFFQTTVALDLADLLVKSTNGQLARACLLGSGSEAMEAAMKLSRQYHLELSPESPRVNFIARQFSWHGCTLSTLSLGDFKPRKNIFNELYHSNVSHVSPCHPYRDLRDDESVEQYVARLKQELDEEFQRVGPNTVCAFVVEPMVGTALGCVVALPGYLQAVREVCDRYGALLVFDEVMCGMGRTGTYHSWQHDNVVPDILAVGKGLAAGYGTISAMLINQRVVDALKQGSGNFVHGQTYQCHPLSCVAALEVQRIVLEEDLVSNVRVMGDCLEKLLRQHLAPLPYVGDIRGRGLFWSVEFVKDKVSKEPFDVELNVAKRMRLRGLEAGYDICLFSANGCADGRSGDHFLLAPPYIIRQAEMEELVRRVVKVVHSVLAEVEEELSSKR